MTWLPATVLLLASANVGAQEPGPEMWDEPSHKLVFNRDGVRVVDVNVPPGAISHYHSHRFATLYVVVQDAKIRSQRQGGDWFDLSQRDRRSAGVMADRSDYAAEPYVHRVHIVDDRALRLVAIVNERAVEDAADVELAEPGSLVDNAWFKEYRVSVDPGGESHKLRFDHGVVVVQFDDGAGYILEDGVEHSRGTVPGAFSWHAAGSEFRIVNDTDERREYVLVEVIGSR